MKQINEPVVHKIKDNQKEINNLRGSLDGDERKSELLLDYPTVYIHHWKRKDDKYEVYIGEANDVVKRSRQHLGLASKGDDWHKQLNGKHAELFIIGHDHFNKSLTMDLENRFMDFMVGLSTVHKVHNKRKNPQYKYYTSDEMDIIFRKIWSELMKWNPMLFLESHHVLDSAMFKASPFHDLTKEQQYVKEMVIKRVQNALKRKETGQLIFIAGEAGTGKTVLISSLFYELNFLENGNNAEDISCYLVDNHKEQVTVYEQIAKKLNLGNGKEVVNKAPHFIKKHKVEEPVDVVLIDEAHLLLTRGSRYYSGKNQLSDIRQRAKVVVAVFDKRQILRAEQYWESQDIRMLEGEAKRKKNYFKLERQLRITGSEETVKWLNQFTKAGKLEKIPKDDSYEIKICETPEELEAMIKAKARISKTKLSRMIATYDWEYNGDSEPEDGTKEVWEVSIGNWKKPWNLQTKLSKTEKEEIKTLSWAEQSQTIDEVGSTYTIQGFDLCYAGVILGPSVKYKKGEIVFDPECSKNKDAITSRLLSDGTRKKFGKELIGNEVNVLMTRGVQGIYIYACDETLREALKNARG